MGTLGYSLRYCMPTCGIQIFPSKLFDVDCTPPPSCYRQRGKFLLRSTPPSPLQILAAKMSRAATFQIPARACVHHTFECRVRVHGRSNFPRVRSCRHFEIGHVRGVETFKQLICGHAFALLYMAVI